MKTIEGRSAEPMPNHKTVRLSWSKVDAFRLSRHHLSDRQPFAALGNVATNMAGAQAQVLSAGQMSLWARLRGARIEDMDSAIWKDRSLVRAWCMRGTLFLLPSAELAVFARGTNRRSGYHFRWAVSHVGSKEALHKLLDSMCEILKEPSSREDIALHLKSNDYKLLSKAGGGWGHKRAVPWVKVGSSSLPVGYLLHVIGAREVICSGPPRGNESSYVLANKWIPGWKDVPVEEAERKLLVKYLRAFGPSTVTDFALWAGMYVRDAKEIWSRATESIVPVDVEGWKAHVLESDLSRLEESRLDETIVRLLPNFDSYLLGHKSHRNIVDEKNQREVYRSQGWVSPVLLVDGKAMGVWSHKRKGSELEISVVPFSRLSQRVSAYARQEAEELGRFLDCTSVKTIIE